MKYYSLILIIASLFGCGESYEVSELYIQRIRNSSMVLYEYNAWSKYNDSHKFGYTIMDSSQIVLLSKVERFPISYLADIPTNIRVDAINLVRPKKELEIAKKAINAYSIKKGELEIYIQDREKYFGYSSANPLHIHYTFDTFRETRDSVIFAGISKEREEASNLAHIIGFKKGNIKLIKARNSQMLVRIEISQLVEENGEMYKYRKETRDIEEVFPDKYIRVLKTITLEPNRAIEVDEFSDYGMYKLKEW